MSLLFLFFLPPPAPSFSFSFDNYIGVLCTMMVSYKKRKQKKKTVHDTLNQLKWLQAPFIYIHINLQCSFRGESS